MKTITLPIETKVREFDGKLWLALHLAREGCAVYLGPDQAITDALPTIRPDIHLLNSGYAAPLYREAVATVKAHGGRIAVLDTEGGIYRERSAYAVRLSPVLLRDVDIFLAWGPDPASIVQETMGEEGPEVVVTGNPSFDMLREQTDLVFAPEAAELRREFGHFVLINTNFGYANPFTRSTVDQRTETQVRREMEELLFDRVVRLAQKIAQKDPDVQVVLRPHPSEDHERYKREFGGTPNLHVIHKGPVTPWLRACAVLIHNVCTTGVEAAMLGRPVLAYCPTQYHFDEFSVANGVSEKVRDDETILARVQECLTSPDEARVSLPADRRAFLENYIANVTYSASERITSAFIALMARPPNAAGGRPRSSARALTTRAVVAIGGERLLDKFRVWKNRGDRTQLSYVRQKFPGITKAEIEARIERMAQAEPTLGRVRVRKIRSMEHTFVIEPVERRSA